MLALLGAVLAARKCSDGLCLVPAKKRIIPPSTTTTITTQQISTQTQEINQLTEPLIYSGIRKEELTTTRDVDYYAPPPVPLPIYNQTVNETIEMYETSGGGFGTGQTLAAYALGGGGAIGGTTMTTSQHNHQMHSSSHHNIAMSSMFSEMNNGAAAMGVDYELSRVTCLTMTPNEGKYAIVGQSVGSPQVWDTLTGQLIRTMSGTSIDLSNLSMACNGRYLVGLSGDGIPDANNSSIKTLQIWEVQTGQPIQMSHQIKCSVFTLTQDTNSIVMAGNQRFGNGISVGILDLVTFELTKEIKSDPDLIFGQPLSISITPDEKQAIVGCAYMNDVCNFVVFDLTKSTEIAQTKSIAFNSDPKCVQVLSNSEVLIGSYGGNLIQWNLHTCQVTHEYAEHEGMTAHTEQISQLCLSKNRDYVVSASYDDTAKVWSTRDKSLVSILNGHRGPVIIFKEIIFF
jgi:WD40 repeat protein